jgi:hypothetical protein
MVEDRDWVREKNTRGYAHVFCDGFLLGFMNLQRLIVSVECWRLNLKLKKNKIELLRYSDEEE